MNVRRFLLGGFFSSGARRSRSCLNRAAARRQRRPVPGSKHHPDHNIASQRSTQGSAPLRVMVGKSLLINTTERLKRISLTDPASPMRPDHSHADPRPRQLPGEISLLIWDELERSRSFDLRVDVDVSACAEEEHRVFPTSRSRYALARRHRAFRTRLHGRRRNEQANSPAHIRQRSSMC